MLETVSFILCLLLGFGAGDDDRDEILLKNGKRLRGRIVAETEDRVQLQVGTTKRWYKKTTIESFSAVQGNLLQVLQQFEVLEPETPDALLELADLCKEKRLPHEENLLYWRILSLDPNHEEANQRLEHRKRGEEWLARVKTNWVPVAKLDKARSSWAKAWTLRSEHFEVRCDHSLKITLDTLFEFEYFYHYFYQLFARDLGLSALTDPVQVYLYKDEDSFPSQGTHAGAYFDEKERVLYTYVDNGRPHQLFRVATQGLLYMLIERAAGSKGAAPVWLEEAMADHMQAIIVPLRAARPSLEPDRVAENRMRAAAQTRDPFSITRILNFEEADYLASTKQDLKYGQGYALFHYMLLGKDKHRKKFLEYINKAMNGQGQASTFNRLFKPSLKSIEVGHLKHARNAS